MGMNGVDNAKLSFDNVRVPRTNLLNKYSDITPEGTFVTKIKVKKRYFLFFHCQFKVLFSKRSIVDL